MVSPFKSLPLEGKVDFSALPKKTEEGFSGNPNGWLPCAKKIPLTGEMSSKTTKG